MAARPGSSSLLESLLRAKQDFDREQSSKPSQPFNFGQTVRSADKAIQQGVFGLTDAIGHEGQRLWDGKFGFDALSESLPKLADSGLDNLAQALATTRQGGAQWSAQDTQAQRDRDNLGKATGGALDASMLLPAVPAVKVGLKGVGEFINGPGRAFGRWAGAGDTQLNMFIGPGAIGWNKGAAKQAAQMEKAGATPEEIWGETGTAKNYYGKWRQEIDDSAMTYAELPQQRPMNLPVVVDHPELFAAEPRLEKTKILQSRSLGGNYYPLMDQIEAESFNPLELRKTVLHEIQHAEQKRSGNLFASKGTKEHENLAPNTGNRGDRNYYRPYEREARITESRADMNAVNRRENFPFGQYEEIPVPKEMLKFDTDIDEYGHLVKPNSSPTTLSMGFGFSDKPGQRSIADMLGSVFGRKGANDRKLGDVLSNLGENPDAANTGAWRRAVGQDSTGSPVKAFPGSPSNDLAPVSPRNAYDDAVLNQNAKQFVDQYGDFTTPRGIQGSYLEMANGDRAKAAKLLQDNIDYLRSKPTANTKTSRYYQAAQNDIKNHEQALRSLQINVASPANPLDQFMPPTSLDDIWSGGAPKAERELTGEGGVDPNWTKAQEMGLDLSKEAIRARAIEQGFDYDNPLFHGMPRPMAGDRLNAGSYREKGLFATSDPKTADHYAADGGNLLDGGPDFQYNDGAAVYPVIARNGQRFAGPEAETMIGNSNDVRFRNDPFLPPGGFQPPRSLDELFIGGAPRGPRELSGGAENPAALEGSTFNDPRITGAPEVPYTEGQGFGGLDQRLGNNQISTGGDEKSLLDELRSLSNNGNGDQASSFFAVGGDSGGFLDPRVDRARLSSSRYQAPEGASTSQQNFDFATSDYSGGHIKRLEARKPFSDGFGAGAIDYEPFPNINQVMFSKAEKGSGAGKALYNKLLADTLAEGKLLASDSQVSPFAAHVYDRFKKDGFSVARSPSKVSEVTYPYPTKGYTARNGEPVFIVGEPDWSEFELLKRGMQKPPSWAEYQMIKAGRAVKGIDMKAVTAALASASMIELARRNAERGSDQFMSPTDPGF